jgi:hypothetical protein
VTIGQWVRRIRMHPNLMDGKALTKWHLVESVVDDEPVTRCGRRLRRRKDSEFEASDVMPLTRMIGQPQLCSDCQ